MVQSIILTGPTAVGKSSLALELAEKCNLEIINADTVCFYRDFNIGSAKPDAEALARVRHHLIDIADPKVVYHAGQFLRDLEKAIQEIHARNKRALIVGGSGFYLKALRFGLWDAPETSPEFRAGIESRSTESLHEELLKLDPEHAKKIGGTDRYRLIRALEILSLSGRKPSELQAEMKVAPVPDYSLWVLDRDPAELSARLRTRIEAMLSAGFLDEVIFLRKKYPGSKMLSAVGYAQIVDYLDGVSPEGRKMQPGVKGLVDEIELSHRKLAKSQRTWFKNLQANERFILDGERETLIEKLMNFYQ
jgi:tRNA dimethylallyltransferase